jgi:uncharacterized membrane protein
VLAIDYDDAKKMAIGLIVVFVVLSVVSAIVIKNITTKLVSALLLAGFALGAWTQRTNLQDCATEAREKAAVGITSGLTCNFFGNDITIVKGEPAAG